MAGGLALEETARLLGASLCGASYLLDTQPYVALTTVKADATQAGTEVGTSVGDYSRQAASFAVVGQNTAQLNAPIDFPGMPGGQVVGINVYDAPTAGNRKWWADLAMPRNVLDGDTISFAPNYISFTIG